MNSGISCAKRLKATTLLSFILFLLRLEQSFCTLIVYALTVCRFFGDSLFIALRTFRKFKVSFRPLFYFKCKHTLLWYLWLGFILLNIG